MLRYCLIWESKTILTKATAPQQTLNRVSTHEVLNPIDEIISLPRKANLTAYISMQ